MRKFLPIIVISTLLVAFSVGTSVWMVFHRPTTEMVLAQETPFCANGQLNSPEECDDNGWEPGDGCSASCTIESGWTCNNNPMPSVCQPSGGGGTCGNGTTESPETCDDGNNIKTDACPDGTGGTCRTARCGDNFIRSGVEQCDDGGTVNGDGCSATCQTEPPPASTCDNFCRKTTCGDGVKQAPNGYGVNEECEKDSDCVAGGQCDTSLCRCVSVNAVTGICGNGVREGSEFCDDGKRCTDTGERCRVNADCGNGDCKGFSGDGCTSPGG